MEKHGKNFHPRICILTHLFYPIVGGGETHARTLSQELIGRGIPLFVLTRRRTMELKKHEYIGKIPIFRVPPAGFQRFGKYLMMVPTLWYLFRMRSQYDIIYVNVYRVLGVVAVISSFLFRKKCILRAGVSGEMSGDFILHDPVSKKSNTAYKLIEILIKFRNQILLKSDSFISISKDIQHDFLTAGVKPEKIRYIPNGVDTRKFSPVDENMKISLRTKFNLPIRKLIFTYTGKLNRGKGLELLIRVWQKIVRNTNNSHLVLVGSGDYQFLSCEDELRSAVKYADLQEHVTFTGYVENVHEYLQCSDYFIFPSESEGLPNSLLEALSCALPCIATRAGGIVDIIRHNVNGNLISIGNEQELYEAILYLRKNLFKAEELGRNGRELVCKYFSIDRMIDKNLLLYSEILNT